MLTEMFGSSVHLLERLCVCARIFTSRINLFNYYFFLEPQKAYFLLLVYNWICQAGISSMAHVKHLYLGSAGAAPQCNLLPNWRSYCVRVLHGCPI